MQKSQPNVVINVALSLCVTEMKLDTVVETSLWSHIRAFSTSIVLSLFDCLTDLFMTDFLNLTFWRIMSWILSSEVDTEQPGAGQGSEPTC